MLTARQAILLLHATIAAAMLNMSACTTAEPATAKSVALSDYFVMTRGRESHLDLHVRTQEGGLKYIGSMMDPEQERRAYERLFGTRTDAGEPMVIVSEDGRAVAFYHQSDLSKGRSSQESGVYDYEYDKGARLLHPVNNIVGIPFSQRKDVPSNVLTFDLLKVAGGWTSVPWAVTLTAEGTAELPLALLGATELHKAAYDGNVPAISQLLDDGQDINARTYWAHTPLYVAIVSREEQAAKRLLERGADLTAGDFPYLHLAALHAQSDLIEAMLERGMDVNAVNSSGNTTLGLAAHAFYAHVDRSQVFGQRGRKSPEASLQCVTILLKHGADPDASDSGGDSPLHRLTVATTEERVDVPAWAVQAARLLIDAGADAAAQSTQGNTPLHTFSSGRFFGPAPSRNERVLVMQAGLWEQSEAHAMLALLVSVTPNIDARNSEGMTPLQLALRSNHLLTARYLVDHGADDSFRYADGVSAREWMERALGSDSWKPVTRP